MKKLFVTFCALATLASFSGLAFAATDEGAGNFPPAQGNHDKFQGFGPHKFSPEQKAQMEKRRAEIQKRLKLTEEQKAQMKTLHESAKVQIKPLFDQLRSEHEKMMQLRKSNASTDAIQAQREKIKALRDQIKSIRMSQKSKIDAILTPTQKEEFKKMHEEFKAQHKGMKGHKKGKFEKQNKQ